MLAVRRHSHQVVHGGQCNTLAQADHCAGCNDCWQCQPYGLHLPMHDPLMLVAWRYHAGHAHRGILDIHAFKHCGPQHHGPHATHSSLTAGAEAAGRSRDASENQAMPKAMTTFPAAGDNQEAQQAHASWSVARCHSGATSSHTLHVLTPELVCQQAPHELCEHVAPQKCGLHHALQDGGECMDEGLPRLDRRLQQTGWLHKHVTCTLGAQPNSAAIGTMAMLMQMRSMLQSASASAVGRTTRRNWPEN